MFTKIAILTIVLVHATSLNVAATEDSKPEIVSTQSFDMSEVFDAAPTQLVTPRDSARGCCLVKTAKPQCAATNRGFCRKLAADNNATFVFHEGAQCRNVAQCPLPNEGTRTVDSIFKIVSPAD